MPIPISCPRCGVTREVKDKYVGLKVQCKNCGEFVRVSQFEVIEEVEVIDEPVLEAPPIREIHQRKSRVRKSREGMHLGVVVSLFAVGIIIITSLSIGLVSLVNPFAFASSRFGPSFPPSTTATMAPPTMHEFPSNAGLPHTTHEFIVTAHRSFRKGRESSLEVNYTFLGPTFAQDGYYEVVINVGNGKDIKRYSIPKGQPRGNIIVDGIPASSSPSGDRIEIWVAKKHSPNESGEGVCVSNRTSTR